MPGAIEEYEARLNEADVLGHGFSFRELVAHGNPRKQLPPEGVWSRMIPTLALANEFRKRMVERHGIGGLAVKAAYRPEGGAARSQHKENAALDLDLLHKDYSGPDGARLTEAFYREAVRLWCEQGRELQIGLGLYCAHTIRGGVRVHIDTHSKCRTWQIVGEATYVKPPLALSLCDELELLPPTRDDRLDDE